MSTMLDLPVISYLPDDQAEAVAAVLAHLRTLDGVEAFLTWMPGENDPHIMGCDNGRWFAVCAKPARYLEHQAISPFDLVWLRARAFGHMSELGLSELVRVDTAAVARVDDLYSISIRQDV